MENIVRVRVRVDWKERRLSLKKFKGGFGGEKTTQEKSWVDLVLIPNNTRPRT